MVIFLSMRILISQVNSNEHTTKLNLKIFQKKQRPKEGAMEDGHWQEAKEAA